MMTPFSVYIPGPRHPIYFRLQTLCHGNQA
jgi:hypothetical protein